MRTQFMYPPGWYVTCDMWNGGWGLGSDARWHFGSWSWQIFGTKALAEQFIREHKIEGALVMETF